MGLAYVIAHAKLNLGRAVAARGAIEKGLELEREAIDAANFTRAAEQAQVVIRALQRATRTLRGEGS